MNMFDVLFARSMNSAPLPPNAHLATAITSQPITDASDYPLPKCDVTVTDADKCEVIVTDDGGIVEDSVPYNFRQSAGGDTELDELVGGTVAWNQLVQKKPTGGGSGSGLTWTFDSDGFVTVNGTSEGRQSLGTYNSAYVLLKNNVYHIRCATDLSIHTSNWAVGNNDKAEVLVKTTSDATNTVFTLECMTSGKTFNNVKFSPQIFNLTLLFGSTIADYIYSIEQSTAGAGVAWLKEHFPKLFDDGYKAYNTGELVSVKATAHETVGFNQWDEEWTTAVKSGETRIVNKNPIRVFSGLSYYFKTPSNIYVDAVNADGVYQRYIGPAINASINIPSDVEYIAFSVAGNYGTTYNNDICINISDTSKNGTYEPYKKHSYPLSPVELRGLFKLDTNNKLYCDGDEYRCDGRVKRRYGIVDLGTLTLSTDALGLVQLNLTGIKTTETSAQKSNILCAKYVTDTQANVYAKTTDKTISGATTETVRIYDTAFVGLTNAQVSTALSGVYLVYELATPTEEYTSPFEKNQAVDAGGTEEYVDDRSVSVPVGHSTKYYHGKAYTKHFPTKSGVVEMADEGIMPMTPMYITANGSVDAEYWR